jgi:RNA polymerase II subunit A C-terminal domain phosphatase SSU72
MILNSFVTLQFFQVKLPGPAADRPNVYEFGTTYEDILADLVRKDRTMYTQNGILHMLDRNKRIKQRPQRLQVFYLS